MSVTYYANLILGIRVTRADFLTPVGSQRVCQKGHAQAQPTQRFCGEDGTPFVERPMEFATPAFQRMFDEGVDPKFVYHEMLADGPLFYVDRLTSSESNGKVIALGHKLQSVPSEMWGTENPPAATSFEELFSEFKAVRLLGEQYGIRDRAVEMFVQMYASV